MAVKKQRSLARSLLSLNWFSLPSRLLPHGLSGAVCLLSGTVLIAGSISGSYVPVRSWLLPLFLVSSGATAVAGYLMANRAPQAVRPIFQQTAAFQVCLVYHAWRFFEHRRPPPQALDCFFAAASLLTVGAFTVQGVAYTADKPPVAAALVIGSLALLLFVGYPVQLAVGGEEWWTCVKEQYPMQAVGMVAYIFVPAIWTFSAMLFGATLLARKIIGPVTFGVFFLGLIVLTLVTTVLTQEVHLPAPASTQRLYLPCPEPEAASFRARMVGALDTSVLAQGALGMIRRWTSS